ncbi:MAG: type III polyketide synthase [SAR324 cluster bacterium]|nr:type III polyketide synthase [SAR324 cluster bacterium]
MKIISVGTAFPKYEYTQRQLTEALLHVWKKKYFNVERLRLLHQNLLVGTRRFCIPLEEIAELQGLESRTNHYITHAVNLGEEAIFNALETVGLWPDQVDHLFFTSVTGIATPSIDARLVNRLKMKNSIRRTPIFGLGCLGGAAGIARAMDYVKAYPDHIAVLLSVELCSLTIQKNDLTIPNIVGTGLFGDGAAAVVIAGANVELEGPKAITTRSAFYPETERIMGWDIVDEGFKIVLSPHVPKVVTTHAKTDVQIFLGAVGLSLEQIEHYICHPGGPKVLEALQETLGISAEKLKLSWQTLREMGNMSSTSVLLVLKETMERSNPETGDYGLLMAMGPGFCSEWVLLQW